MKFLIACLVDFILAALIIAIFLAIVFSTAPGCFIVCNPETATTSVDNSSKFIGSKWERKAKDRAYKQALASRKN